MISTNFAALDPRQGQMMGAPSPPSTSTHSNTKFYEFDSQSDLLIDSNTNSPYNNITSSSLDLQAPEEEEDPRTSTLPRILLMGPRRGGKTSINRIVFSKMSPHETLFRLESTQSIERIVVDHTPLCRYTIWDIPGDDRSMDFFNDEQTKAIIFVIDAQDEPYDHVLQHFTETVSRALHANPNLSIEVFINKVDGELFLSDEAKYDCRRDIMEQVSDELYDAGIVTSNESLPIHYHLTSIYDHSVFDAVSRVAQKLIQPSLAVLENLLNVLVSKCSMEKAYLFDVASKLYIATDSLSVVDSQSVELCSDMIDVVLDVSGIYGYTQEQFNDDLIEDLVTESAYDEESSSLIRLSNGMVLYLKQVDSMLALVCLTRSENFRKKSLINYNIACLKQALKELSFVNVT